MGSYKSGLIYEMYSSTYTQNLAAEISLLVDDVVPGYLQIFHIMCLSSLFLKERDVSRELLEIEGAQSASTFPSLFNP